MARMAANPSIMLNSKKGLSAISDSYSIIFVYYQGKFKPYLSSPPLFYFFYSLNPQGFGL
jgi:hypothetical protein